MLDIQQLRNDLDTVVAKLASRKFVFDTAGFTALEAERKEVQTRTQDLQARRNASSKQIGIAKSKGEDVSAIMAEVAGLGEQLKADEERLNVIQVQMQDF
ncbi:MAG: seryl-tRNA synthetase, partial [Pseudomonadota bacterium]